MSEFPPSWIDVQKRTLTEWCNSILAERMLTINDLDMDFKDGVMLCALLEIISGKSLGKIHKHPKMRVQQLENANKALTHLRDEGFKLGCIGPEDIADGHLKLTMGLVWTIMRRYIICAFPIIIPPGVKEAALEWVRLQIPEYDIHEFAEEWRDGRALCALCASVEPDSVDLSQMQHKTPPEIARMSIEAAERRLAILPIFHPEDLVSLAVHEFSLMTYVSYFRDYVEEKQREKEANARSSA